MFLAMSFSRKLEVLETRLGSLPPCWRTNHDEAQYCRNDAFDSRPLVLGRLVGSRAQAPKQRRPHGGITTLKDAENGSHPGNMAFVSCSCKIETGGL
jgi:hypothetical protein